MTSYNTTRYMNELLEKHASDPPSFTVHLYPEHWTLNGGSRFLYNNQVASLLDDIQAQRIPNDFLELFDTAKVAFYDGCMIVELLDYRPPKAKDKDLDTPEKSKVVLAPNAETLWAEICLLNQKNGSVWTDQEALEVESKILLATAPPLCLEPDPHLTRIANTVMRVSAPTPPGSLKRKAAVMEEEDEIERTRRAKIMQYMNPRVKPVVPSYRILDVVQRMKMQRTQTPAPNAPIPTAVAQPVPAPGPIPTPVTVPMTVPMQAPPVAYAVAAPPVASTSAQPVQPALTPVPAATAPPSSTPTPPVPPITSPDAKRKAKRSESSQSPLLNRPPSTLPTGIPPHMQAYQAQLGRATPVPPSHTPRPSSAATITSSPAAPEKRPTSTVPNARATPQPHPPSKTPQPQQAQPAQQPQQPQPSQPQQPHPVQPSPALQPRTPQQNPAGFPAYMAQPGKAKAPGGVAPNVPHQAPVMYYSQQLLPRGMPASGTPVPQMVPNAAGAAQQRGSPMVAGKTIARAPMPNGQQPQPQQHLGHQQQQPYNFATMQNFAQMRGQHPHFAVQQVPHHVNGAGAQGHPATAAAGAQPGQHPQSAHDQAQAQAQAQAHAQQQQAAMIAAGYPAHMFYPQMRQMPSGYWQVPMGRGGPVPNGQHQIQHPQLGAGRAIPGGTQGS